VNVQDGDDGLAFNQSIIQPFPTATFQLLVSRELLEFDVTVYDCVFTICICCCHCCYC